METRHEKFEALNTHVKITRTFGNTIAFIAFIPLFIGIYRILTIPFDSSWDEYIQLFLLKFPILVISFSLFYAAGLLFIISELIKCFLAIEENTYQSAQNTSSNQPLSSN